MTVFHRVTEGKLGYHDGCTIEDEVSQEFLDRIPGGLFRYRADDEGGTIDYVSRDVLELFGCATYEEFCSITGNSFIGMVHPNDRQRVTEEITSQIKCGNTDAVTYTVFGKRVPLSGHLLQWQGSGNYAPAPSGWNAVSAADLAAGTADSLWLHCHIRHAGTGSCTGNGHSQDVRTGGRWCHETKPHCHFHSLSSGGRCQRQAGRLFRQ